jgi:hypothetical protein
MDKIFDLVESECEKLDLEDVLDKQAVESDNAEALKFDSLDNEEDAV